MASQKRQRAQKMADRGISAAKIERKTGVSSRAAERFATRAAAPTATTSSPTTPKIKGVKQGLRIAGAGGISGGELKDIRKATGMSDERLIRSLDKVNKKLKGQDKTGISINAGAVNKIIKQGIKQRAKDPFGVTDFGTGKLGMTIAERMGDPGYTAPRNPQSGAPYGGSREAVPATLMKGGMQIRPGGRERVQGFGKQYELSERFKPKDEVVGDTTATAATDTATTDTVAPVTPEEIPEELDTSQITEANPFDLASWATGFKRARSSRQRAGRRAQGLASQKKSPFKNKFK